MESPPPLHDGIVRLFDGELYLIGVSHISGDSHGRCRALIEDLKPRIIGIELDKERFDSFAKESFVKSRTLLPFQEPLGPSRQVFPGIVGLAYSSLSSIGTETLLQCVRQTTKDVQYCGEIVAALEGAVALQSRSRGGGEHFDVSIALVDRSITVTLARLGAEMGWGGILRNFPCIATCVTFPPAFVPSVLDVGRSIVLTAAGDYAGLAAATAALLQRAYAEEDARTVGFGATPIVANLLAKNVGLLKALQEGALTPTERKALSLELLAAMGRLERGITAEELARKTPASSAIAAFLDANPKAIGDERDACIAHALDNLLGGSSAKIQEGGSNSLSSRRPILCILGAAHVAGVTRLLEEKKAARAAGPFRPSLLAPPDYYVMRETALPALTFCALALGVTRSRQPLRNAGILACLTSAAIFATSRLYENILSNHTRIRNAMRGVS